MKTKKNIKYFNHTIQWGELPYPGHLNSQKPTNISVTVVLRSSGIKENKTL